MKGIDWNALRDRAYENAKKHGFHDEELSNEHLLCLVISELMEAVEADRKGRLGRKCKSRFEMDYNRYPALVEEEKRFKCSFEKNVKDSLPDELADAVIRLLDLAGLLNINIEINNDNIDMSSESCVGETFAESIYGITDALFAGDGVTPYKLTNCITNIFGLAKHLEIDLFWHIKQKMKYNELRPRMHNKAY